MVYHVDVGAGSVVGVTGWGDVDWVLFGCDLGVTSGSGI